MIIAYIYMRKSNYYATRMHWHYELVEKRGPLYGHRRVMLTYRILNNAILVIALAGAVPAGLVGYFGYDPPLLLSIAFPLLGLAFVLLLPAAILRFLVRTRQVYNFDRPDSEPDQRPP
jgi:hypothetical protein